MKFEKAITLDRYLSNRTGINGDRSVLLVPTFEGLEQLIYSKKIGREDLNTLNTLRYGLKFKETPKEPLWNLILPNVSVYENTEVDLAGCLVLNGIFIQGEPNVNLSGVSANYIHIEQGSKPNLYFDEKTSFDSFKSPHEYVSCLISLLKK